MTCPSCSTENREGAKFCRGCGNPLALACPACGAAITPGQVFCDECGTPLDGRPPAPVATPPSEPAAFVPAAEHRLVSVLFADLVGFTQASAGRDAEDTRQLLSTYFDTCRTLITRYGGTVEKFIGDAVMAVWGAPVANEDDAERAVRAALDLVAAVPELGPGLQARAGVLTGEAAVTIGADGEGMVAGDLVNTASRIQSAAEPGAVLVGDATRRATDAAVLYEDAGVHELKGKTEPEQLHRALRITAGRAGALRGEGLEAPFVGRERELRLVKQIFHAVTEEEMLHLVSVVGQAGIGKSRLAWELFKYADGLADTVWWHRGRCLAYGDGVAFSALAEMVRVRAAISEGEERDSARRKLRETIAGVAEDEDECEWLEPRLAHLLGLEERVVRDRDDLFPAWRLFIERLAERHPCCLVFEDVQWADKALLEFIEYVLDWSRNHAIFVLTLARPEVTERHPSWTAAKRNSTTLILEPLPDGEMEQLLDGLVPGLPAELRTRILDRAEGVPLYAVETVRMLLDRGALLREARAYRPVGSITELDVPETLHALIAARLDGLSTDDRHVLQDAAVLGKSFTISALAAVSGRDEDALSSQLRGLAAREMLTARVGRQQGEYAFLQDLVRHVAYETLARRDRKARHLVAARYFEAEGGRDDEVTDIIAAHYETALELEPDADDVDELRTHAREALVHSAARAESLGAPALAAASYRRAAELGGGPAEEADLRRRAGSAAVRAGVFHDAQQDLHRSIELFESAGDIRGAAKAAADLGWAEFVGGRLDDAVERMELALPVLEEGEHDADFAYFLSQLARYHYFVGNIAESEARNDRALDLAERFALPDVLAHALSTASLIAIHRGRWETGRALVRRALDIALEHDLHEAALRGYNNASVVEAHFGNFAEMVSLCERGVEYARRIGSRSSEWFAMGNTLDGYAALGRWDEIVAAEAEIPDDLDPAATAHLATTFAFVGRHRGDLELAERALRRAEVFRSSASLQDQRSYRVTKWNVLMATGAEQEALELAQHVLTLEGTECTDYAMGVIDPAIRLGRLDVAAEMASKIESLPPGKVDNVLRAETQLARAQIFAARGDLQRAEDSFLRSAATFREYGLPFFLAHGLLLYCEWLVAQGRTTDAEPLAAEAREIFAGLEARPWLERLEQLPLGAAVRG